MSVTFKLDGRFKKQAKVAFGRYDLKVGVLDDRAHKRPVRNKSLRVFAGGPVRKTSRTPSGFSIAEVGAENRRRMGINYLTAPFKRKSDDIIRFSKSFFELALRRGKAKRTENLLQAIVRNPILRGDYGGNSPLTTKIKGFSRLMIDTGQLFRAINARIVATRGRGV